jgi:hypothetical protein
VDALLYCSCLSRPAFRAVSEVWPLVAVGREGWLLWISGEQIMRAVGRREGDKQSMRGPVRLSTYTVTRLRKTPSLLTAPRTTGRRVMRGTLGKLRQRI